MSGVGHRRPRLGRRLRIALLQKFDGVKIRRTHEEGHGIAKAGLILGYVFTGLGILFFIVYFIFIASVIANTSVTR